jgi:hypothetical protein
LLHVYLPNSEYQRSGRELTIVVAWSVQLGNPEGIVQLRGEGLLTPNLPCVSRGEFDAKRKAAEV